MPSSDPGSNTPGTGAHPGLAAVHRRLGVLVEDFEYNPASMDANHPKAVKAIKEAYKKVKEAAAKSYPKRGDPMRSAVDAQIEELHRDYYLRALRILELFQDMLEKNASIKSANLDFGDLPKYGADRDALLVCREEGVVAITNFYQKFAAIYDLLL